MALGSCEGVDMDPRYPPFPLPPSPAPSCPASPAKSVESGSDTSEHSHTPELATCLTRLALAAEAIVKQMENQVQAINRLADSNRDLVLAMAEDGGMDSDEPAQGYLNARPT